MPVSHPSSQSDSFRYGYIVLSEGIRRLFIERSEEIPCLSLKLRAKGPKSLESWRGQRKRTFRGGSKAKLRRQPPRILFEFLDPANTVACDLP